MNGYIQRLRQWSAARHAEAAAARAHNARPLEWIAEKFIFLISLSAILMVFLIFLFVAREAWPVALGQMNSSLVKKAIAPDQMEKMSQAELMEYLELTPKQFAQMDKETLKDLMLVKVEAAAKEGAAA